MTVVFLLGSLIAIVWFCRTRNFFAAPNSREAIAAGTADYVPIFMSEVPSLFNRNVLPLDVAIIQVSPPDAHGYCSLGVNVDFSVSAVRSARQIVAMVRAVF